MKILCGIFVAALASGQIPPQITNVTNAAFPSLDLPANSRIILNPGSMATIWGANLSDSTASTAPPWKQTLGGTQVHLLDDNAPCGGCDVTASLIFVSATQINFVVPKYSGRTRIVIWKGGVPFDNVASGPGHVSVDNAYGDEAIFQVGFDCLASYGDTSACGFSSEMGAHRAPLGAITDASGNLITSANPLRQGMSITIWAKGFTGAYYPPTAIGFGVAKSGKDFPQTVGSSFTTGEYGALSAKTSYEGYSPQFVGLDQINVMFPACSTTQAAASTKMYDAFVPATNTWTGTTLRIYAPLMIAAGEPDCESVGWKTR